MQVPGGYVRMPLQDIEDIDQKSINAGVVKEYVEYISAALNTMAMGESMQLSWISYLFCKHTLLHC